MEMAGVLHGNYLVPDTDKMFAGTGSIRPPLYYFCLDIRCSTATPWRIMTDGLDINYVSVTTMDITYRKWLYLYSNGDDGLILANPMLAIDP